MKKNQFTELKVEDELIGIFCIYQNPNEDSYKSYIEHWAFVDKSFASLFGKKFHSTDIHFDLIRDRDGWVKKIDQYGEDTFSAFIHRKALLLDFSPVNITALSKLDLNAESLFEIYLDRGKAKDELDWLIIQENVKKIGLVKQFHQVSIAQTLESGDSCLPYPLTYSECRRQNNPFTLGKFVSNPYDSNINRSHVPDSNKPVPRHILIENVVQVEMKPSKSTVPLDNSFFEMVKWPENG